MTFKDRLVLAEKGLLAPGELKDVLLKLEASLKQVIIDKGPTWCSVAVYGNKNNKGAFSDFLSTKHNKWTTARQIEVYKKMHKKLLDEIL